MARAGIGKPIDTTAWPVAGPMLDWLRVCDRLHRENGLPSLRTIALAMHLRSPTRVNRLLRGLSMPSDEEQARALLEALGGVGNEVDRGIRLYRKAKAEDTMTRSPSHTSAPISSNTFAGGLHSLASSYLDPSEARSRILDRPFVGREWLVAEIDAFIQQHDRGYFLVEADAGAGKSAFALWYSGQGQRPCHFTQLSADARTTEGTVRNLAAQLIASWDLKDLVQDGTSALGGRPAWLLAVLSAAARRRTETAGAPIVIVVDGLDEAAEQTPGSLPLGLPAVLPPRVYVVATARTGAIAYEPEEDFVVCAWHDRQEQDFADRSKFLQDRVSQPWLADRIRQDGSTPEAFITSVLDRCGDNWLYIGYVLDEIRKDLRRARDVRRLPRRLESYYRNNTTRLIGHGPDAPWRTAVLATLAVAREPMTPASLAALAGADKSQPVEEYLYGALWPFCSRWSIGEQGQAERFALKHLSFREFLVNDPEPRDDAQSPTARAARERLAAQCHKAIHRICDRYLDTWGTLDAGLPALARNLGLAELDSGYGLRQLVGHLLDTNRAHDLHLLMRCESDNRNLWWAAHERTGEIAGFLDDVGRARKASVTCRADRYDESYMSLHVRYGLIEASVASISDRFSPELIGQQVDRGLWTATRAFSHVERMTDQHLQIRTLIGIANRIPDATFPRALSIAVACRDSDDRAAALQAIIPRLPDELLDQAIGAVGELEGQTQIPKAARALIDRLPDSHLDVIPWQAMPAMRSTDKSGVSALVALRRGGPHSVRIATEALYSVGNKFEICQFLAAAIPDMAPDGFDEFVSIMLACPGNIEANPWWHWPDIAHLLG